MGAPVSGINPRVLTWARERSGQSIEQVAKALAKEPEIIEAWEAGLSAPTYPQLEALAYRVYKRPIALFFFPEPPDEPDPAHSFRTLPTFEIDELTSDTRFKIRQARALQIALYQLNEGTNPAPRKVFRDIRPHRNASAAAMAGQVRQYLGVDIATQRDVWKTPAEALNSWKEAVEDRGVYIFKNSFKQKDVSGFCLYDREFPLSG